MEVFFLAASLGSSALSQGGPLSHRASDFLQQLAADPQLLEEVTRQHFAGDPAWEGGRGLAEPALVEGGRRLAAAEGSSFHSIFFLTCNPAAEPTAAHCNYWDWQFFGFWLAVLVVVTIVIEVVLFERLEEAVHGSVLAHHIYQKIVRELALMGLVSFTAIIMTNTPVMGHAFKVGSEWRFLMLEIAHIMIFVMAIMFCIGIFLIYRMVKSIEREWSEIEDPRTIEDPNGSIGKPNYDPWRSPFQLLERLNHALPSDSLRGHALAEGAAGGTVLPDTQAHHATSAHHHTADGVWGAAAEVKHAAAGAIHAAAHALHDVGDAVLHHQPTSKQLAAPSRRRRTAITEGGFPQAGARGSETHRKPTRRERGDMHVARKHAMHFILQFQFKRAHRLTNMNRFVYATYLSKSLRTHIIDILEPSRTTWAILFIMGVCCFLLDGTIPHYIGPHYIGSGDRSGSSSGSDIGSGDSSGSSSGRRLGSDGSDGSGGNDNELRTWAEFWTPDPQNYKDNRSPTTVNIWVHAAWILINWLPALGAFVLRVRAKNMYMRHVDAAFKPFAKAWTEYYREHNPIEYEALIKLPEQEQSIYYMLFGFIATKGAGPNGTVEGERESLTRGTTCARLHGDEEAPLGGGATAAAADGDVSPSPSRSRSNIRKSVSFLSERASSGSLKAAQLSERSRPLRELGALMRRCTGWLAGQWQKRKSKHQHHHHHEHKKVHPVLRQLEVVLSTTSFFLSFFVLFWVRESMHAGYAAIAFFEYNGEQYCPDGYNSSSYDISSDSSSSGSSSSGGDSSSSSSGRRLGSDGSDGSDGSSSGSAGSSGGDPPDGTLWMYENIYQFFRVCPGGGDAHVALLVLLPLIEIFLVFLAYRSVLMSTIATVKYFSVATAVEQVDNNIIGDIEQEKELEGDFQAAMVMQHNHLDRTIRDVTSIKKVKERVNSQLRLAQITWRHRVVRKNPKTGLDEDILTKTKELLADAESHIVDFLAHYDKAAAAASNKEGRESRYTSCSQTTSRSSGGDAGGDAGTALSRVTSTGEVTEPPGRKSVAKTASLHERARLGIVQASKEHLELLGSDDDAKLLDPIPEPALPEPPTCDTRPVPFERTNSSSPEAKRAYGRRTDKGWAYRGHAVDFREQVGKIKQYHAVVRMIHNPKTLDEDDIIQTFLVDAHLIFDGMPDNNTTNALRCDTLNSMGTHKQNRKLFADATDYFHKAMDIRTQKLASDAAGLAQACVSLGNNLVIAQEPAEKQLERCQEALPLLEKALHHYQAAFHQKHPKLSHAHEGIAECKLKLADLDGAQQHLDKAYEIKNHHRQGTEKLDNLANAIKEARREAQPKSVVSMIWKKPSIAIAVSMTSLLGGERSPSASPTTERMPKNAAARWKMAKTGSLKLAKGVEAQPAGASPNSKRPSVFSMANDLASSISRSPRGERKRRASKEMASSTDAASPTGAASSTTDRQGSTDRV